MLTTITSLTMKKVAVLADFKLFRLAPRSIFWYCLKNGKMKDVKTLPVPLSSISCRGSSAASAAPTSAGAASVAVDSISAAIKTAKPVIFIGEKK